MKLVISALVIMAVLVGFAAACEPKDPGCDISATKLGQNVVIQSNTGSASDFQGTEGVLPATVPNAATLTTTEANNAFVFGSNNGVTQSNDQSAFGRGDTQDAKNCILVFGDSNTATQKSHQETNGISNSQTANNAGYIIGSANTLTETNNAYAPWTPTVDDTYGEAKIIQVQNNMGAIVGSHNTLTQSNRANAEENSGVYYVQQTQKNEALVLGDNSKVTQANSADANVGITQPTPSTETAIETEGANPITQNQKNFALVIGTSAKPTLPACGTYALSVPKISVHLGIPADSVTGDAMPNLPVVQLPSCTIDC